MDAIRPYWKSVVAVLVALLSAAQAALITGDQIISPQEWVNIAIAGVTAAAVFAAPNIPGARYTKGVLAALGAGLTVLASVIIGGVSTSELIQIVLAAAGAVGVFVKANVPLNTVGDPNRI